MRARKMIHQEILIITHQPLRRRFLRQWTVLVFNTTVSMFLQWESPHNYWADDAAEHQPAGNASGEAEEPRQRNNHRKNSSEMMSRGVDRSRSTPFTYSHRFPSRSKLMKEQCCCGDIQP